MSCEHCYGDGWILDDIWRCGDPECCGTPMKIKCPYCDNDWTGDEE